MAQYRVQQVLEMREHLRTTSEIVQEHLREAQTTQKQRYNTQIQSQKFVPMQKVHLLLSSEAAKLFAQWQGPYEVIRRIGPVDYEVQVPDHHHPTHLSCKPSERMVGQRGSLRSH